MSKNRGKLTRAKAEAIAVVNLSIASALCLISIWASLVSEVSLRVGIKIVYIPTPSFSKFVGECAWDHLQKDLTRFRPVTSTQCLKNQLPVRNVGGPLLLPLHHGECALPVPVPQQQETLTGNYLWFQVPVVITIVCVAAHDPAFRSVFSGGVQRRLRLRAKQRGSQAARQQGPSLFCNKKPKLTSFARRKAQLRRYAKIRSFIRLFLRSYKLHHVSNDHDDKNNQRSQCSHQHQQSTNCNHAGINEDGEVPILEKELLHLFRSLRRVFGGVRKTPGGPRGTRKRGGESNAQDAGKPKKRSSGASQPSDTGGEDKFPNSNDAPGGSGGHDSGSTSMPSAGNVPKTLCSLCDCKGRHFHGCGCGQDGTPSKKMKSVGKDQVDGYNKLLSRVKDHPMWDEARTLGATDENVLQVAEGDAICDRCYNHDTVKLGEYMSHFPRYWLTVKGKYKTPSTGIAKWLMETTAHQQAAAPEEGNVDSASPDQNTPDAAMPRGRHCRLCDCKAHHHMDCECGQTGTSSGSGQKAGYHMLEDMEMVQAYNDFLLKVKQHELWNLGDSLGIEPMQLTVGDMVCGNCYGYDVGWKKPYPRYWCTYKAKADQGKVSYGGVASWISSKRPCIVCQHCPDARLHGMSHPKEGLVKCVQATMGVEDIGLVTYLLQAIFGYRGPSIRPKQKQLCHRHYQMLIKQPRGKLKARFRELHGMDWKGQDSRECIGCSAQVKDKHVKWRLTGCLSTANKDRLLDYFHQDPPGRTLREELQPCEYADFHWVCGDCWCKAKLPGHAEYPDMSQCYDASINDDLIDTGNPDGDFEDDGFGSNLPHSGNADSPVASNEHNQRSTEDVPMAADGQNSSTIGLVDLLARSACAGTDKPHDDGSGEEMDEEGIPCQPKTSISELRALAASLKVDQKNQMESQRHRLGDGPRVDLQLARTNTLLWAVEQVINYGYVVCRDAQDHYAREIDKQEVQCAQLDELASDGGNADDADMPPSYSQSYKQNGAHARYMKKQLSRYLVLGSPNCSIYSGYGGRGRHVIVDNIRIPDEALALSKLDLWHTQQCSYKQVVDRMRAWVRELQNSCPKATDGSYDYGKHLLPATLMDADLDSATLQSVQRKLSHLRDDPAHKPSLHEILSVDLVRFFEDVTRSSTPPSKISAHYKRAKSWRISFLVFLLANIHDPRFTFMQTLIGLCFYAGGIRKPQWFLCQLSGISITYEKLRVLKNAVVSLARTSGKMLSMLNPWRLARLSFDNLNCNRPFSVSGSRMLNLITCQFSQFRGKPYGCTCSRDHENGSDNDASDTTNEVPHPLPCDICKAHASCSSDEQKIKFAPLVKADLEQDLKKGLDPLKALEARIHTDKARAEYNNFLKQSFDAALPMLYNTDTGCAKSPSENTTRYINQVKTQLTSYTAPGGHRITYAAVDEGQTATRKDVGKYLDGIKKELKVGTDEGPAWTIMAGDQQTFKHMVDLKKAYSMEYSWLVPMVGEWHCLFNCSQWLCDQAWDGGLSLVADACNLPGMKPTGKYRDTHRVLTTMWAALTKMFVSKYAEHCNSRSQQLPNADAVEQTDARPSAGICPSHPSGHQETQEPAGSETMPPTAATAEESASTSSTQHQLFRDLDPETVNTLSSKGFQDYMEQLRNKELTENENVVFWARWFETLSAYISLYMAIRTGNWHLRCSALYRMAAITFALHRPKYEEVISYAVWDDYIIPDKLRLLFETGEWTVSALGKHAANQALDEAHESGINLGLKKHSGRPTLHRMRDTAEFSTFCDDAMRGLETYLTHHSRASSTIKVKPVEPAHLEKVMPIFHQLLKDWENPVPLRRADSASVAGDAQDIEPKRADDLLNYSTVGMRRFHQYILQYHFGSPLKGILQAPRDTRRMQNFSKPAKLARAAQSMRTQMMAMVKTLRTRISKLVAYMPSTLLPLAYCTQSGEKRGNVTKSDMFDALAQVLGGVDKMCVSHCHFEDLTSVEVAEHGMSPPDETTESDEGNGITPSIAHAVILDALRFLHEGPSPSHETFGEWYQSLCLRLHARFRAGATTVIWVADDPDWLPIIRDLLHQDRAVAAGAGSNAWSGSSLLATPSPSTKIAGLDLQAAITNKLWKAELNKHIADHMAKYFQRNLQAGQTMVIDAPGTPEGKPIVVQGGQGEDGCLGQNAQHGAPTCKGEADNAIWLHAKRCKESCILVVARDTDIWMYGLALAERGDLGDKTVLVERKRGQPLIDLSRALASIREHPKLKRCEQPVADLLFIYLQSGSDYISKTYFVGHKTWLGNFLEHLDFVLSGTQVAQDTQARLPSFLTKEPGETGRLTIRDDAACRFIACPFWGRCKGEITTHSTAVKTIADLWVEMKRKREDRDQRLQTHLKEYLFRDPGDIVPAGGESWEVDDFLSVLRRAGYSKSADDAMLLPSLSAIRQHKLRTEYVINLVYQSTSESRPIQQQQVQNYGWEFAESGKIKIKWYDPNDRDIVELKQRMEKISDVRGSTGRAAPSTRQTSGSGPSGRIGIAPRKPCSCGKGNRDRSSDCCTRATCSCSKEHLPCIAPDAHGKGGCHCHGGDRCRNVHRDGGTCAQCPLPPNQVSMADIVPDPTGGATITTPETTTNYEDSHEEDGRVGKEDPLTIDAFHRHLLQAEAQQEEEEKQEQEDSSDPNELGEEGDNDGDEDIEQYFYGE